MIISEAVYFLGIMLGAGMLAGIFFGLLFYFWEI